MAKIGLDTSGFENSVKKAKGSLVESEQK